MPRQLTLFFAAVFGGMVSMAVSGCPTEDVPPLSHGSSSTGADSGTDDGTSGLDESGDGSTSTGSETGEPDPEMDPCDMPEVEGAGTFDFVIEGVDTPIIIDVETVCNAAEDAASMEVCQSSGLTADNPGVGQVDSEETYRVLVYRPDAGMEDWPEGPLPLVVFMPGNGHFLFDPSNGGDASTRYYDPILTELARQGAVVVGVQPPGPLSSSDRRRTLMALTLVWARSGLDEMSGGFAHRERLHDATVLMGHSRGGAAAFVLTEQFPDFRDVFFEMNEMTLCATIPIAPRWGPIQGGNSPETATDITIPLSRSVAYFVLQGAIDSDTTGHAVSQYDALAPEDDIVASMAATLSPYDKLFVWIYGVDHNAFGGGGGVNLAGTDIAEVVAPALIARFLRWQIIGDTSSDDRELFMNIMDPEEALLGDSALDDTDLWDDGVNADYYLEYGKALIFAQYSQGTRVIDASTESQPPERLVIDTMARRDDMGEFDDLGCGASATFLDPDADDNLDYLHSVEIDGLDPGDVCQGSAESLLDETALDFNRHQTRSLRVDWSTTPGSIRWNVEEVDASNFTHLSIRLANVAEQSNPACVMGACEGTTVMCSVDEDCLSCQPASTVADASFELEVELQFEDTDTTLLDPQAATSGVSLQQQFPDFGNMFIPAVCPDTDSPTTTMRTVRIPLQRFCEEPVATQNLRGITLHFPTQAATRRVLIDSIELTRSDLDDPGTACSVVTAAWACETTENFEAIETSCDTEPSPDCPTLDVIQTEIDAPTVDDGLGLPFSGWVVHTPAGWLDDPENPSPAEIDSISERCIRACEREWAHDPFVAANCSATDVFETPVRRQSPNAGPLHEIPQDQVDGSGLFMGESLSCNLHSDCCEEFDEPAVCVAAPARVTPAAAPLGTGEEWVLAVEGVTVADSSYAMDEVTADMVGTIGYSFCREGDGESCPFYVGSMELTLTEPLELALDCGGSTETHELEELEIRLAQPAMGIAQDGTSWKAFPPRAVVVEATGTVDGFPIYTRAPIESPIFYQAGVGWILLQGTGGSYLEFEVPCNGEIADVKVAWAFDEVAANESPPLVSIAGLPSSVSCPDTLALLVSSASDPDSDIASLRWIVDGVLLEDPYPTIPFTQAHEITAVVRDARGATTTDTKVITCI